MKFLHTADWHLGQTFYEHDRHNEHRFFLDWILQTIEKENVDVLLVSGDVFDTANPQIQSVTLFYGFLHQLTHRFPYLQAIFIAGNHDSPARLEMPRPLLENTNIHLIGQVKRYDNSIDYQSLIIPLCGKDKKVEVFCLAVPYLRLGEYPRNGDETLPDYATGVTTFYREITQKALHYCSENQGLIALGHLHVVGADIADNDTAERAIIGGIECMSAREFPAELQYVALGHIHKGQKVGGENHIRYSGSPIPLSFSERNYEHQVVIFQMEAGKLTDIKTVPIPVKRPLLSLPENHGNLAQVLSVLQLLPPTDTQQEKPFLEVKIALDTPLPDLKNILQKAVAHKNVQLVRIDLKMKGIKTEMEDYQSEIALFDLKPIDVFRRIFEKQKGEALPQKYEVLFNEIYNEIENQQDSL